MLGSGDIGKISWYLNMCHVFSLTGLTSYFKVFFYEIDQVHFLNYLVIFISK